MAYFDPEAGAPLKSAVETLVTPWPDVEARTAFGCPSYFAAGTIFAVVITDGVVLTRLSDAARDDLAAEFDTAPFDPQGRTVQQWITARVGPEEVADLQAYVEASYERALEEAG